MCRLIYTYKFLTFHHIEYHVIRLRNVSNTINLVTIMLDFDKHTIIINISTNKNRIHEGTKFQLGYLDSSSKPFEGTPILET